MRSAHSTGFLAFAVLILTCTVATNATARVADRGAAKQEMAFVIVSSAAGDRLARKPDVSLSELRPHEHVDFKVDETLRYQTIVGFGASFLEAGMICLNSLQLDQQEAVLRSLFDEDRGAGFSAMKTPIAATDFMSAGPWYSYDDKPNDVLLENFTINRDLAPNGVLRYIKRAEKYGHFVLEAPMDYPPDWMLVDRDTRAKQDVQDRYFDTLALYYMQYLQAYAKQGITIDYLSPFNEPGIYTHISYDRIRRLIRNHIGPLLFRAHLKTRLMISEAENRGAAFRSYPSVLEDPAARQYVSALAYHGYQFRDFDKLSALHDRYPALPIWMTEVCHAYICGTSKSIRLPLKDFEDGDFWGNVIFSDLQAGASAWIYWNMILDQNGGPWLVSPTHADPDDNVQQPLVIINRQSHEVVYTGAFYYLAHFSKFVRPGSVRLGVVGSLDRIRAMAFETSEKHVVIELINSRPKEARACLAMRLRSFDITLPALSITTVSFDE
jgi:glucosylceramidase